MDLLEGQKPVLVSCSFCGEKIEMTQIVEHCKMCKRKYETVREESNNAGASDFPKSSTVPEKEEPKSGEHEPLYTNQALERKYNISDHSTTERDTNKFGHGMNVFQRYGDSSGGREEGGAGTIVYICPYCRVPQIPGSSFCGACGARRDGYDERFLVDRTGVHAVV